LGWGWGCVAPEEDGAVAAGNDIAAVPWVRRPAGERNEPVGKGRERGRYGLGWWLLKS
jgi:hypothetical protein